MCESIDCSLVNNCSNHGECIEPNVCKCELKYAGKTCSDPSCSNFHFCSQNGVCLPNETCQCLDGWKGFDCSTADCSELDNCNQKGICIKSNKCECFDGYDGARCEDFIGANKFNPVFELDRVSLNLSDVLYVGSVLLVVNAYDNDTGRNGLINFELIEDCFGLLEIDSSSGELKLLKLVDSVDKDISHCVALVQAFDDGTPPKSTRALLEVDVNIFRFKYCDDLLANDLSSEVNLESQKINQASIRIGANNILSHGARNISYYLDNQNSELLDHIRINEQNGAIFLVKKIQTGSYNVYAYARQM